MIASFGDKPTASLFNGDPRKTRKAIHSEILAVALRKLDMLNAASTLSDLNAPPGNRLEPLAGDRHGFHSIRVNTQWRVIFRWQGSDAFDVQVIDYH